MKAKGIVLLAVLSFLSSAALAQTGRVTVTGDVKVNDMVARHVELNNRVKTMPGFRVQIASFSGINSKNSAFSLRDRFMTDYPEVQAYIIYDEPNFKVKVGDFRSRLEAYAFLQEIKEVYKGYIIKDNIFLRLSYYNIFRKDGAQVLFGRILQFGCPGTQGGQNLIL